MVLFSFLALLFMFICSFHMVGSNTAKIGRNEKLLKMSTTLPSTSTQNESRCHFTPSLTQIIETNDAAGEVLIPTYTSLESRRSSSSELNSIMAQISAMQTNASPSIVSPRRSMITFY